MTWFRFLFMGFCAISTLAFAENDTDYHFKGRHLIASYGGCNKEKLENVDELIQAVMKAVKDSGATILQSSHYIFPPNGLTMVVLLSESHASIHTYPEHNACFVDLFTCGEKCSNEKFDQSLREYLKPTEVNSRILLRQQQIEEQ